MYLAHYNLAEKPFQITPDPRFLWLGEKHREALAALRYAVRDHKGFLLLTGDVGTGKTTLIRALLNHLDSNTIVATVVDPSLDILEFFTFLADIFHIKADVTSKVDFLFHFTQFLQQASAEGKTVLLIIDEAQRLSRELLEEIRLLSNIESHKAKLLNIFFVGQNEFNALLMQDNARALRQRIGITYHITPLTEAETRQYVEFRLQVAGSQKPLFDQRAIREVFQFSRGYPRLINIVCDHALLTGYVRDMKSIPASVVRECARELTLPGENQPAKTPLPPGADASRKARLLPKAVLAALVLLVVASGAYLVDPARSRTFVQPVINVFRHMWNRLPVSNTPPPTPPEAAYIQKALPLSADQSESPLTSVMNPSPTQRPDTGQDITEEIKDIGKQHGEAPAIQEASKQGAKKPLDVAETDRERHTSGRATSEAPAPMLLSENFHLIIPFDYDTNALPIESRESLDRLATAMKQNPDVEITVAGYTDTLGSHRYNVKLSEFRAMVVKSYLMAKGIGPHRIEVAGKAEENPARSNETPEGRSANRRVEIRLKLVEGND